MDDEGCRVLVIDDVEALTHVLELFLSRRGYRVWTVNDSRKALSVVREFRPQVVLLDIAMPYMSGYEVARRIRKEVGFEAVPIVAVSAFDDEVHLCRAQQVGIDHQIVKPCNFRDLDNLIQECCNKL